MLISRNWLSEYIDIPFTPTELSDKLTMLGIEVDSIEDASKRFERIVVGEVLEAVPHPNADKLRLTRVSIGSGEPLRIVCGAPNARVGLKVAVATVGADLGEGFVIRKSKIRGEVSEGMLCSERELGLSEKHEGIWELPETSPVGMPLAEALGKSDVIFEIGITPNRADCLSHIGIAREVRAITGEPLRIPAVPTTNLTGEIAREVRVTLDDPDLCPRYVAKLVRNVTVKPSPDWLKRRLESAGLRPINNVVDVTNFVLMECGHPLHAFDFSGVDQGHVVVRRAGQFATEYKTLDGKTRKLPADALLIADPQKPLGIAGIMGGENSEITDSTTTVLIESAYFNPTSIRRTGKTLGLSSDASYRFERGTDINILPYAAERAAALIAELTGGTVVDGTIDEYPNPLPAKQFRFRPGRCNMLLSMEITSSRMLEIFSRLNIGVDNSHPAEWVLTAPSYRVDLEREEDAIEEIARVVGYDEIPSSQFEHAPLTGSRNPLSLREFDGLLRNTLLAIGASECVSTPLVSAKDALRFHPKPVEVINPLNLEKNRMRSSVAINLLDAAALNERFGAEGQRLFEMGNVFHYSNKRETLGHVQEKIEVGLLLSGVQEPKTPFNTQPAKADIFFMKGIAETLLGRLGLTTLKFEELPDPSAAGSSASKSSASESIPFGEAAQYLDTAASLRVTMGGKVLCVIGKVSAKIAKEYDLRQDAYLALFDHAELHRETKNLRLQPKHVSPLPKYPGVERDLALVLKHDIPAGTVAELIRTSASSLLTGVRIFDEFQSPEMKAAQERSLAFRLAFRSDDRTLEEHEVDDLIFLILKRLASELHARLRA